jgi:hypothetical protein
VSGHTPPKRAPGDHKHLERLIGTLSESEGIARERMRRWVSTMVLLGALGGYAEDDADTMFILKGGVALELRLRLRARATKDVDIIVIGPADATVELIQDALQETYAGFSFRVVNPRPIPDTPAHGMDVKLAYRNRAWGTLQLEAPPCSSSRPPSSARARWAARSRR